MTERVRAAMAAANHELRDAHSLAIQHLKDGGVEVKDAIVCMTTTYLQLAVLNALGGAPAIGLDPAQVKADLMADLERTFDDTKERLNKNAN